MSSEELIMVLVSYHIVIISQYKALYSTLLIKSLLTVFPLTLTQVYLMCDLKYLFIFGEEIVLL